MRFQGAATPGSDVGCPGLDFEASPVEGFCVGVGVVCSLRSRAPCNTKKILGQRGPDQEAPCVPLNHAASLGLRNAGSDG